MADLETAKPIYEESKSAAAGLGAALNQFRSNATTGLTLASGAAAIFAFDKSPKGALFLLALVAYAIALAGVVLVFWPRDWQENPAKDMPDDYIVADVAPDQTLHDLAKFHQDHFAANLPIIGKVAFWFQVSLGAAGVMVLLMLGNVVVKDDADDPPPTHIVIDEVPDGP